ncbi:MAG: hypothetical protein A2622_09730 [Bdellovibrionales bacterium RIFCSPHIGHO2_01_FULL_40_29]|nr:MAG: hypothetical protein A2622_09730 [Bdellovibrionales bacterium RIFCSPHIGHO2_01_FULL_40_29]OFZ32471.1 MAG: hypothetical protein A3D17_12935 [Bdellovibrionales bacterium RIFCSPHIGHO2_02_FULL_40_15]
MTTPSKKVNTIFLIVLLVPLITMIVLRAVMILPEILDVQLYYTGAAARNFLKALNENDLRLYKTIATLDLIFLSTYTWGVFFFTKKYFAKIPIILTLLPGIFDLIETTAILYALKTTVQQNYFDWLGLITCGKWVASGVLIATLASIFIKRLTTRR